MELNPPIIIPWAPLFPFGVQCFKKKNHWIAWKRADKGKKISETISHRLGLKPNRADGQLKWVCKCMVHYKNTEYLYGSLILYQHKKHSTNQHKPWQHVSACTTKSCLAKNKKGSTPINNRCLQMCVLLNWTHIAIALALSNIASHCGF